MSEVRQTWQGDCTVRPAVTDRSSTAEAAAPAGAGHDAARALVRRLAEMIGMQSAFLGRIDAAGSTVDTVAAWVNGRYGAISYSLAGSPCENVVATGICVVPRDAARLYPKDTGLVKLGVESYAGIVVRGDDGSPCGVLAALGSSPVEPGPELEAALRLHAARARGVLAQIDAEQAQSSDVRAPRRAADRARRSRDEILTAVVDGGERLLRARSWLDAVPEALELIGRAARVSTIALYAVERHTRGGATVVLPTATWSAPGVDESNRRGPAGLGEHLAALEVGEVVELIADGVGMLLLPVREGAELCGILVLETAAEHEWVGSEKEALRAAAGIVGAAAERDRTARDLRSRERILHAVALSAEHLLAASSWRDAIQSVLESLGRATEASRAYLCVSRVEASGRVVSSLYGEWLAEGISPSDVDTWADWIELPEHAESLLAGGTTRHGIATAAGDVAAAMRREATLAEINVPLLFEGELLGYIGFDDCVTERRWSIAEEEALHVAASLLAGSMAVELGMQAIERRERILEAVAAVGATLLDAQSWRSAADEVLAALGAASGADRAQLFECVDPDHPELVSLTHLWAREGDVSELSNPVWNPYRLEPDAVARFEAGRPVSNRREEMTEPARSAMKASGALSFTSLPIHVHGRFWGLIGFDDCSTGRDWTAAENEALRAAAGMLGAAVERTLTDEMLEASETQLRQAQKMEAVGRLASGIAHDFNNILTGIGGFAALLAESDDDTTRGYAGEIVGATEHAGELVRRLLSIGRPPLAPPERIDVTELVRSLDGVLRGLAGSRTRLVVSLDENAPPVLGDGAQLGQVVVNLVANAADAIESDGTITVSVERGADGSSTRLAVLDDGVGMNAATMASAFEPFVTSKAGPRNSGLGLSIVYGIVQAAGGSIELDSEPGRFTRAVVTLPAAPA